MMKKEKRGRPKKTKTYKKTGRKQTADYLPWSEAKRLINLLYKEEDYEYMMIFIIGIYFGLRIGDMCRVTWDDLMNKKTLILPEEKTGKTRNIPINNQIRNLTIRVYHRLQPESKYVIVKHRVSINQKLKRLAKKYDVKINNFSTHTFRKTFGRHYLEKNNYSAKALLLLNETFNHGNIRETKKYLGITKDEIETVYNTISDEPILI